MRGIARVMRAARSTKGSCGLCLHWRPLHATPFGAGGEAISVLCERCFERVQPGQRLGAYRQAWAASRGMERDPATGETLPAIQDEGTKLARFRTNGLMREWQAIHAAVMEGK